MPLRSQIVRKQQQRPRQTVAEVSRKEVVQVRTVELIGRDPRSGLFYGTDQSGTRHEIQHLGAGSGLARVQAAILVDGGPGAITN